MSTTCGKRKLPRSYLPFIGNLIDRFPYSKLPTKKLVLQRLIFEIEHNHCAASLESSSLTVQKELFAIREYAGYRDILKSVSHTLKQIRSLHESYKAINKIPISRRSTESYKKKESLFTTSLDGLFDIAQQNLKSSGLITKEDHDFLVYHWEKTISTTADHVTRNAVQKKLARKEKALSYTLAQTAGPSSYTCTSSTPASPHCSPTSTDVNEFVPKRACTTTPRSTGTSVTIPRDILKKVGPAADRLGLSNQQVTGVLASIVNHSGGNLDDVSISTSTAKNSRTTARKEAASYIKKTFSFTCGQINFDGKLPSNPFLVKLHHLLKPSSPLSNLPGSPLTYPTYPALQLLLATALLWIPSLNSLMTDFFLTTYNISPEETTRSCWSLQKHALVVL